MPTERNDKLFIEWSHKVIEELTTLNNRFDALGDKYNSFHNDFQNQLQKVDEKLNKINELLNGNGTPEKGLIVRIDRIEQRAVDEEDFNAIAEDLKIRTTILEQSESRRSWLSKATIVACLGAIMAVVASYFKK